MKILPITMLIAFLLLGVKIGETMHDGRQLLIAFAGEAYAQEAKEDKDSKDSKSAKSESEEKKSDKKEAAHSAEKSDKKEDSKESGAKEGTEGESEEEQPAKHEYSQIEIDLLQSLAKRREELDDWAKQVQIKENMLVATEGRINDKINSLQKMKTEVEDLLAKYNEQEDMKIRSLVKIYENMKPKDAGRIFEELDMPVLLTVVDKMSERKVSPILASMNPTKAKDLTVQLAEQRKLKKPSASSSPAPVQPAGTPTAPQ